MVSLQGRPGRRPLRMVMLVAVFAALVQPARAADVDQLAESLKWIPADAAFYSTILHCRARWEAILQSQAWAKLKSLPAVQTARQKIEAELKEGGSLAEYYQLYQQPENRQLLELLGDMLSEEVFVYGGPSWVDFLDLFGQVNAAQRYGQLLMLLSEEQPKSEGNVELTVLLRSLANNLKLLKIPELIIGYKLSETARARDQLKRLETLLAALETQFPPLKGHVKKEKLAGANFLTVSVDGSMVPWKQLSIKDFELKEGEFDGLIKKLGQLRLTVALGIRDGYLLACVGDSTSLLKTLGAGQRLSERPELKPLAAHTAKRITSIAYISQALRAESEKGQFDGVIKLLNANPPSNLSPAQREQMRKDLAEVAKAIGGGQGRAGATLSFSFSSERGSEGYDYDYGEHPTLDGSKPLTLLNHVGGSPVFAVVGRSRISVEGYHDLIKAIQVAHRYFEEFAVPKFDADVKEKYDQIMKALQPLLRRLDEITAKMLLPALADGQAAFVVDAKLTSKQWWAEMPPADKPLPVLEPALVCGVSDAALLRKAAGEYRSTLNELYEKLHEVVPEVPDFQIPEPESRKTKAGTLYFYPLPRDWEVDRQVAPTGGVSNNVAVLTISPKHAERLLATTPLKIEGGPLADLKKPRAMAAYFNWGELLHAVTPWVELGLQAAGVDPAEKVEVGDESWQGILKQVPTVLEVLQVFRTYSSSTYFEGPVLVTHRETVIKDLAAK